MFVGLNTEGDKVRKRTEMRHGNTFRDNRYVLQAPLRNSGKIKGSESWLKAKPENGKLVFASDTPFSGLTSSFRALTFSSNYFKVAFLTYRSSLFKSSCDSSQSVFCFIESGIHSDKLLCQLECMESWSKKSWFLLAHMSIYRTGGWIGSRGKQIYRDNL